MKLKTSVTLSEPLLEAISNLGGLDQNRSEFIERAVWHYLAHTQRERLNARDLEIINANAERLNLEASDVLEYQRL